MADEKNKDWYYKSCCALNSKLKEGALGDFDVEFIEGYYGKPQEAFLIIYKKGWRYIDGYFCIGFAFDKSNFREGCYGMVTSNSEAYGAHKQKIEFIKKTVEECYKGEYEYESNHNGQHWISVKYINDENKINEANFVDTLYECTKIFAPFINCLNTHIDINSTKSK